MRNRVQRLFYSSLVLLLSFNMQAQYQKKMSLDILANGQYLMSRTVDVDPENSVEFGQTITLGTNMVLWYNITKRISVGAVGAYNMLLADNLSENSNYALSNGTMFSGGLAGKYHLVDKKKFKFYGKASLQYSMLNLTLDRYYYYYDSNTGNNVFYLQGYSAEENWEEKYSGISGQVDLGMKVYFSNSFGMTTEFGYVSNILSSGATFSLGLFIDLINK